MLLRLTGIQSTLNGATTVADDIRRDSNGGFMTLGGTSPALPVVIGHCSEP